MVDNGAYKGLSRRLSEIERGYESVLSTLSGLRLNQGRIVAVSGPPGAGKSTLLGKLLTVYAQRGQRVAAVLSDPASRITGGAMLGDRIRLLGSATDPNVFVRSVSVHESDDSVGIVAPVMAWTLADEGFDYVFLESVGAGQQELGIAAKADLMILVIGPDSGDWIQFSKAGTLESCDIVVVTKSDLGGAKLLPEVRRALKLQSFRKVGPPPALAVSAVTGLGIESLHHQIESCYERITVPELVTARQREAMDLILSVMRHDLTKRLESWPEQFGDDWRAACNAALFQLSQRPSTFGKHEAASARRVKD